MLVAGSGVLGVQAFALVHFTGVRSAVYISLRAGVRLALVDACYARVGAAADCSEGSGEKDGHGQERCETHRGDGGGGEI